MKSTSRIWTRLDFERQGKQFGHFHLPHSVHRSAYGTIAIPVCIIANGRGPTILLTGGVHGDEYEGQIALGRLSREIDPLTIEGRLIIVPSINLPAALASTRTSPLDGQNLNRVFPGDPDGTPSEQIAYFIETVLAPISDTWFDFHSGGTSLNYLPLIATHEFQDKEINRKAGFILDAFGAPLALVWKFFDEPRMGKSCAERNGIVYISSEFGGGGSVNQDGLRICYEGTLRALAALEVIDADAIAVSKPDLTKKLIVRDRDDNLYATASGVFAPSVSLGAEVRSGQSIGEVISLDDHSVPPSPQYAINDGIVVCLRHPALVQRGDCIIQMAGRAM
jgi:predicted deacylase